MARVSLTVQSAAGPYPPNVVSTGDFALTFAAMDQASGNQFKHTGRELLIIRNAHSAAHNLTLTTRAIEKLGNRTQDITISVSAGTFRMYEATRLDGWIQSDGFFYFSAANSALQAAVVRFEP